LLQKEDPEARKVKEIVVAVTKVGELSTLQALNDNPDYQDTLNTVKGLITKFQKSQAAKMLNSAADIFKDKEFTHINSLLPFFNFAKYNQGEYQDIVKTFKAVETMRDSLFDMVDKLGAKDPMYAGHADDPRNTDNAWMETSVFRIECDDALSKFIDQNLEPGDDAAGASWQPLDLACNTLKLFASHNSYIRMIVNSITA
jgi:hypothetical protein